MKVRALTNVKYGSAWHAAGEIFEIHDADYGELTGLAERAEKSAALQSPEVNLLGEDTPQEEKPKRTVRKRKV